MFDNMRGWAVGQNNKYLIADSSGAEGEHVNFVELTSTGFKCKHSDSATNASNGNYIYMALRRPDGYVGKPPELGTGVFAMDTGTAGSGIDFTSNFPVDYGLMKEFAGTSIWYASSRMTGSKYLRANDTTAEANYNPIQWDYNNGFVDNGFDSTYQSWMWKRHAGFDCLAFEGNGVNRRALMHGLNATPQMMWVKRRDSTGDWMVYHFGANGGSNPKNEELVLNTDAAEQTSYLWGEGPTSTYFELSDNAAVNGDGNDYLALLFSSVTGISKLGYYTGNGTSSSSTQTITTGFQPRFLIIRRTDAANWWIVLDTTRGWASGDDKYLQLNDSAAQADYEFGVPISTGFTLTGNNGAHNVNSGKYIYYCHA